MLRERPLGRAREDGHEHRKRKTPQAAEARRAVTGLGRGRGKCARRGSAQQCRSCSGKRSAQRRRRAGGGLGAAMPEGARPRERGQIAPDPPGRGRSGGQAERGGRQPGGVRDGSPKGQDRRGTPLAPAGLTRSATARPGAKRRGTPFGCSLWRGNIAMMGMADLKRLEADLQNSGRVGSSQPEAEVVQPKSTPQNPTLNYRQGA